MLFQCKEWEVENFLGLHWKNGGQESHGGRKEEEDEEAGTGRQASPTEERWAPASEGAGPREGYLLARLA